MAKLPFNAANVAPRQALDPIPAGWYVGAIVKSDIKPTKTKGGTLLELEIKVMEGEYKGRSVFDTINLTNANPVAVEIGAATLSALCHATGQIQLRDSTQLHGKPFQFKAAVDAADGEYEARNRVKGYKATESGGDDAPLGDAAPPYATPDEPEAGADAEPGTEAAYAADTRSFYVHETDNYDNEPTQVTALELATKLRDGLDENAPVALIDDTGECGEWMVASDFEVAALPPEPEAEPEPEPTPQPRKPGKPGAAKAAPAAPAKAAAPKAPSAPAKATGPAKPGAAKAAAPAAAGKPPWMKK